MICDGPRTLAPRRSRLVAPRAIRRGQRSRRRVVNPASHQSEILSVMMLAPVIPVLTVRNAEDGVDQARALVAGGLLAIEVTLRTSGALAAITAIRDAVPRAVVGAGTVLTPEQ